MRLKQLLLALVAVLAVHTTWAAVTPIDRGAFGGVGLTAYSATAWTPTAGNVVLAVVSTNSNSVLTLPTPWGTWQALLDRNGGAHTADSNGDFWSVLAVVVGASPTSQAPSVGVPGGGSGEAYFIEIPGLNTSSLSSLIVQFNFAAKVSTSGDRTMATTLSTFASSSNLCLVDKYGFGAQPWTAVNPLTVLSQHNTGVNDNVAMAYFNGQVTAPEIDGSNSGDGMGILAMELKVAVPGSCTHPGQTAAGAIAVPNGTTGSYLGKTGNLVTPDCSTVQYKQPTIGNFGVN